jgi:hypothetical protein
VLQQRLEPIALELQDELGRSRDTAMTSLDIDCEPDLLAQRDANAVSAPQGGNRHTGLLQVAEQMISVLGGDAARQARGYAAEALENGDLESFRGWHRIMRTIKRLMGSAASKT